MCECRFSKECIDLIPTMKPGKNTTPETKLQSKKWMERGSLVAKEAKIVKSVASVFMANTTLNM